MSVYMSTPQALAERGLGDCFDAVVTSKDVPHAKPDPDIFLLAAGEARIAEGMGNAYSCMLESKLHIDVYLVHACV